MHDERELLARLKAGDRGAFAEMIEQNSPQIYNLALRMMEDPSEAEEILQETFLQAVRHIGNFRGQSKIGTWLYRIATNQALMRLRRKRPISVPLNGSEDDEYPIINLVSDWSNRPESDFLNSEARDEMRDAILALPDRLRVVFVLRDIEGLTTAETAEILDLSISAVKSRLLRARLKLRDKLSVYFSERNSQER